MELYAIFILVKRKPSELSRKETMYTLDALYTAASAVKGRDATKSFLKDLLTPSERIMLGRRILIAQMLINRSTYEDIQSELKVGRATIARIHRWLEDEFPGFEHAIDEIEKEYTRRKQRKIKMFSFTWIRQKYPLHFLLFTVADELFKKND